MIYSDESTENLDEATRRAREFFTRRRADARAWDERRQRSIEQFTQLSRQLSWHRPGIIKPEPPARDATAA